VSERPSLCLSLDLLKLALMNLRRRPLRSFLTVLGIAIGMTAVVALLGLTTGVQSLLERQFQRLGHDLVLILPGTSRGFFSGEDMPIDLPRLRSVPGVVRVGSLLRQTLEIATAKTQGYLVVLGLSPETFELADRFFTRFELAHGRFPSSSEESEALLTQAAARDLLVDVGEVVRMVDREFRVSGVLAPTGDARIEGAVILPLAILWELGGRENTVSFAWVQAQPGYDVEAVAVSLEEALRPASGSVTIQTAQRVNEVVQTVLGVLRAALTGIAAVALFVGGIGLMNTMYMAILERTREIGILVALGARGTQIVALFLVEAGLLGFMGGVVGVLLGSSLAVSIAVVIAQAGGVPGFTAVLPISWLGISLGFSTGLGVLAGAWPARRAASLRPVDALRYE
jgi:putative ABC transport system permease protein